MTHHTDIVVIGLGPGGEHLAGSLAEAGLDVIGIERRLVGGECPYWGCVPSKMMVRAANLLAEARRIPGIAGDIVVTPDWAPVARRIRDEATDNWNDQVAVDRLVGKGARFIRGDARIVAPARVEVNGELIEARRGIVIATGGHPAVPPIPGLHAVDYWTNHEAVETESLPASMIVIGGGAIGLELGQAYARFGVRVTVVEAEDRLLPLEEPEAGEVIAAVLRSEGIEVRTGASADRISASGGAGNSGGIGVHLAGGDELRAERLLVAIGRRIDLAPLGVAALGLDEGGRAIEVDDHMRAADGVWAIGDVTGAGAFTHMAMYQANIAIADILGHDVTPAGYHAVSAVAFTDPEVASVGLREQQARDRGIVVRTGTQQVSHSARGWIHKAGNEGFIKVVEDAERGVLVGATSVGPHGGEVLGLLSLAVHAAIPVEQLRSMIYAYPTFHRGIEDALRHLVAQPIPVGARSAPGD